jgi:hypothetical protein
VRETGRHPTARTLSLSLEASMVTRFSLRCALVTLAFLPAVATALPSPVDHSHNVGQVLWQEPGSPALPWGNPTANTWNHNHLTADPFNNGSRWIINKAWDNRVLHRSSVNPTNFGHGLIEASTPVRFGWDETSAGTVAIPVAAKNAVTADFAAWVTIATNAYDELSRPDTRFAMAFQRTDAALKEITIQFVTNLLVTESAYAQFLPATATIQFDPTPAVTLQTSKATEEIRIKTQAGGTTITAPTAWNYADSPQLVQIDLEYSDDSGANWADTPQAGFGDITWIAGSSHPNAIAPADLISVFEFDFNTIAKHEIGHAIALNHTGDNSDPIMQDNIADRAYGSTQDIDPDSALAVAITYTHTIPEPASLTILSLAFLTLTRRRHK